MNKRGFIDFDDVSPGMVILPILGFIVVFFTMDGGFFGNWADGNEPGLIFKLIASVFGAAVGLVAYYLLGDR